MTKYIYAFDEGQKSMKDLLGGKGANLSEMKRLGLPVPDGFTITTAACIEYLRQGKSLSTDVKTQLIDHLADFSERLGKHSHQMLTYYLYLYEVVRKYRCLV